MKKHPSELRTAIILKRPKLYFFQTCVCWLFIFTSLEAWAQDPRFTQFFANPAALNPSLSGSSQEGRFIFNFRSQWPKLPGEFVTYQIGYDQGYRDMRSSFGFLASLDQAGSGGIQSINLSAMYAYNLVFPNEWNLRAGIQFGYGNRSLNYNRLIFGDQLNVRGFDGQGSAEGIIGNQNTNFWEVGTGLTLYNEFFSLGLAVHHLNEPSHTLGTTTENLPRRISLHAGYKFVQYRRGRRGSGEYFLAFNPGVYFTQQGDNSQLDLGANLFVNPMIFGLWYRGVPIQDSDNGALALLSGFKYKNFEFLYNYDLPLSDFLAITGGAHEFSIILTFGDPDDKKRFRRKGDNLEFPDFLH